MLQKEVWRSSVIILLYTAGTLLDGLLRGNCNFINTAVYGIDDILSSEWTDQIVIRTFENKNFFK